MEGIKQWYIVNYPNDELGYELTEYGTFYDLYEGVKNGYDIYSFIGVNDSLVRERLFLKLSNVVNIEYNELYETWLYNLTKEVK